MKRRLLLVLCLSLIVAANLVTVSAFAQSKITFWTLGPTYTRVIQALMPEFEKEFPHVELELVPGMGGPDRITAAFASGDAPDIFTIGSLYAPQWIAQGLVHPVDFDAIGVKDQQEFEDLYFPGIGGTIFLGGEAYFLPTEVTTFASYVNRHLFDQAGIGEIPETWEGIRDLGSKLSRVNADGVFERQAMTLMRMNGWWNTLYLTSMMRQLGTDWLDESGNPNFTDPSSVRAWEAYLSLHSSGAWDPTQNWNTFTRGQAAIFPGPSYHHKTFTMTAEQQADFVVENAPYPTFADGTLVSPSYASGLFVSKQSADPKLAWQVANFFAGREAARCTLPSRGMCCRHAPMNRTPADTAS